VRDLPADFARRLANAPHLQVLGATAPWAVTGVQEARATRCRPSVCLDKVRNRTAYSSLRALKWCIRPHEVGTTVKKAHGGAPVKSGKSARQRRSKRQLREAYCVSKQTKWFFFETAPPAGNTSLTTCTGGPTWIPA